MKECAALAQLVEQRFCKAKVPSSSLGGGLLKISVILAKARI